MSVQPPLARRLGTTDAVFIGLGSMIGAGIFAAFAPAAQAAGAGLLLGLGIAALVAYGNAVSSARLAAVYPVSGGAYVYGRERLGHWWGYLAGWGFLVGKTASCAAMALTFASYAAPPTWQRPLAVAAVVVLVTVNCLGVARTARATRVLVTVVLAALAFAVVRALVGGEPDAANLALDGLTVRGVLESAGLLFFAFAGYARLATMGEEVRNPQRTIPRAILLALTLVVIVYGLVAVTMLLVLGPGGLADSSAPILDAASPERGDMAAMVVRLGAAAGALGALFALFAGLGRTSLAMAREGDLPRWLAAVHPRTRVPHRAEITIGLVVIVLVVTTDLRGAIAFSSFGVLVYYAIAHAAALTLSPIQRRSPRWVPALGAAGCIVLVVSLPVHAVLTGVAVLGVGALLRVTARLR